MYIMYIIYRVCVVYVQVVYKTVDGRTLYHALTQICQKFTPPYMWLNTLLGIFIETINLFFILSCALNLDSRVKSLQRQLTQLVIGKLSHQSRSPAALWIQLFPIIAS